MKDKKQVIFDTISDLISDFLYYDRKEDSEDLPVGEIERCVRESIVTKKEIIDHFAKELGVLDEQLEEKSK